MKKYELDRKAYYYAKVLLPGYIDDLKRNIENAEGAWRDFCKVWQVDP